MTLVDCYTYTYVDDPIIYYLLALITELKYLSFRLEKILHAQSHQQNMTEI